MGRKPWINLLKLALTLGAAILIARKVDFSTLLPILKHCHVGYLVLAVGAQIVTSLLIAWRWRLLWNSPGLPLHKYLYFVYLGYFFNAFLPSSATSEAIRVLAFGKKYGAVQESIGVNLLARGIGLALQILIAAASIWFYREELIRSHLFDHMALNRRTAMGAALICIAGVVLVFYFRNQLRSQRWLAEIKRVLADKALMFNATLVTVLIQFVTLFGMWAMFMSLYPTVRLWQIVLFPAIIQLILILPISFGGVGVREYLNLLLFSDIAGIPKDITFAVSILGYVPILVMALLGWAWMLYRRIRSDD